MPWLRHETRLARRRQFVEAALDCAQSRSFRQLTVDDICTEAGLTKGAFYAHFQSKDQLLEALIDDDVESIADIVARLEQEGLGPMDRLRRLIRAMLDRNAEPGRAQLHGDLWAMALSDDNVLSHVSAAVRVVRSALRRWIDEAIAAGEMTPLPSNALASVVLALNEGLMLHRAIDESGFRWGNVSKALDSLLVGLQPVKRGR